MCGIAGILLGEPSADATALSAIGAMTDRLRHRGPCDSGHWIDAEAGIALGHRRLSILDLSPAGHQPMASPSGRFVASYNGEIYNFQELRSALEARGYAFRGGSDTEVLVAAWECWGAARTLNACAGMFALAVWDRRDRRLHLARDRLGKKPLYVGRIRNGLAFASELKALLAAPGFAPTLSTAGLGAFLRKGWIGDPDCIWREAFKLPPGTGLTIEAAALSGRSPDDLRRCVAPWWRLEEVIAAGAADPCTLPLPDLVEELDRLLRLCVSQRMIADVPLGAFLSGGVDSSVVVALMQRLSDRPVRTYTIGFDEAPYDETANAARVAAHLGTDHTVFRVSAADMASSIPDLPAIWDEPFADDSALPTLLLARLARRDVTVALSGDGGDEAFGGYSRHFLYKRLSGLLRLPGSLRRAAAGCLTTLSPAAWDGWLSAAGIPPGWLRTLRRERLHRFAELLTLDDAQGWYDGVTALGSLAGPGKAARVPSGSPGAPSDPLSLLMYRDTTEYLPGDILVKVDRATMACGLECRSPLLDHRLLALAWRIPLDLKLRDGQGKWILRQVLRRYVPDDLMAGKRGFDVPVGTWLRGPLRDWGDALIEDLARQDHDLLDPAAIRATWTDHCSGRRDRSREVWALAMLGAWMQHWRAGERALAARSSTPPPILCPAPLPASPLAPWPARS